MRRFAAFVFVLLLSINAVRADVLDARHLPEGHPYRPVLERWLGSPRDDQEALQSWLEPAADEPAPPLNEAQSRLTRELTADLIAAAARPATCGADWPLVPDPENPDNVMAATFPEARHLRRLAGIAVKSADRLPSEDAIAVYAAAAQLGRQQRSAATLVQQLTGTSIESIALTACAKRLQDFDAPALRLLEERWSKLMPAPDPEAATSGELEFSFIPVIRRVLLPGLKELAAQPPSGPEAKASDLVLKSVLARHSMAGLLDFGDKAAVTRWLERIRNHPKGAEGYAEDLIVTYRQFLAQQLARAAEPRPGPPIAAPDDPILVMLMPTFSQYIRTFHGSATRSLMLQAAIHHRLTQLGQTPDWPAPADPWATDDDKGFALETTPDGGFLLRSRYEVDPDQPLTYKFAAPDAGLVRRK